MIEVDTSTTAPPGSQGAGASSGHWLGRHNWLLAAPWLMFLAPALLAILTDDGNGLGVKVASTLLMAIFGAVFLDGARRLYSWGQTTDSELADFAVQIGTDGEARGRAWPRGLVHFTLLVLLVLAQVAVGGVGTVGALAFVVAFAVFHFPWPIVATIYVASIGLAVGAPVAAGRFAELWFLPVIVAAVGASAALVRLVDAFQFDQNHLRTQLTLGDERSRVARDVHDVLGHSVTAMIIKVELCQRLLDQVDGDDGADQGRIAECRQQLADLESIGRGALAEIRSTVGGLRATNLADEVTAARSVLADAGIDLLVTGDSAEVPEGYRPTLAWVVREAVTNIVRHAKAEHCHIELAPDRKEVLLRITDDGVGIGTAGDGAGIEGNGLQGLRERVAASGAALRLEPARSTPATTKRGDTQFKPGTRIEVLL